MAEVAERTKSAVRTGYGILNRYGEFWSQEIHNTPEDLRKHFDDYWRQPGFSNPPPFSDYCVVKVKQTLTYLGPAE